MSAERRVTWSGVDDLTPMPVAAVASDELVLLGRGPASGQETVLGISLDLNEVGAGGAYNAGIALQCRFRNASSGGPGGFYNLLDATGAVQTWTVAHAAGPTGELRLIFVRVPCGIYSVRIVAGASGAGQANSTLKNTFVVDPGGFA